MNLVKIANNKIKATDLFANVKEVKIIHNGEEYTLRLTNNKKLILTK